MHAHSRPDKSLRYRGGALIHHNESVLCSLQYVYTPTVQSYFHMSHFPFEEKHYLQVKLGCLMYCPCRTDWHRLAAPGNANSGCFIPGSMFSCLCSILQHTGLYPIVSKGMRLIAQGKDPLEGQKHMCGMGNLFHYHSTGFPELDEIMRNPQPLIFIMELLQVGRGVLTHWKWNIWHSKGYKVHMHPRKQKISFFLPLFLFVWLIFL